MAAPWGPQPSASAETAPPPTHVHLTHGHILTPNTYTHPTRVSMHTHPHLPLSWACTGQCLIQSPRDLEGLVLAVPAQSHCTWLFIWQALEDGAAVQLTHSRGRGVHPAQLCFREKGSSSLKRPLLAVVAAGSPGRFRRGTACGSLPHSHPPHVTSICWLGRWLPGGLSHAAQRLERLLV